MRFCSLWLWLCCLTTPFSRVFFGSAVTLCALPLESSPSAPHPLFSLNLHKRRAGLQHAHLSLLHTSQLSSACRLGTNLSLARKYTERHPITYTEAARARQQRPPPPLGASAPSSSSGCTRLSNPATHPINLPSLQPTRQSLRAQLNNCFSLIPQFRPRTSHSHRLS